MSKAENLVIMFTDIVGFTELTSKQSRHQNQTMLRQHEKLLVGVAKSYGGKRIKSIGDALLLVFKSPTDAVHCAMGMHDALWEHNQTVSEEERLNIRVSLNSGEVRIETGDVFGEPVNVAARLEGITPANEVYFTEAIYLSMNKAEVMHEFVGKHKLKGIPEEVSVYRVPRGTSAQRLVAVGSEEDIDHQYPYGGMHLAEQPSRPRFQAKLPIKKMLIAAVAIGIAVSAVLFWPSLKVDTTSHSELKVLLENDNLVELEQRVAAILAKEPDNPMALFMQGHINIERRSYKEGLELYGLALSSQPELAEDLRYAENLIKTVSGNGSKVTELAKLSPTQAVVDEFAVRSVSPGLSGRRDAAYILRQIERQDVMDSVAMAILDLKESKGCEDKRSAINILKSRKENS